MTTEDRFDGPLLAVRMGEYAVSDDPQATLAVIGLGSCVALAILSPEQQLAGLAHVVLPDSSMALGRHTPPGKFADTAVPALLDGLREKGAKTFLMRAVLVGGSAMFGSRSRSQITAVGERNIDALAEALGAEGIRLMAADVGGLQGRSVQVEVGPGRVITRVATGQPEELYPGEHRERRSFPFLAA